MTVWRELARAASELAEERGEWCGAPMPVDDYPLSVAKTYGIQALDGVKFGDEPPEDVADTTGFEFVNSWWCSKRGGWVHLFRENGRTYHYIDREYAKQTADRLHRALGALQIAFVQDPNAEITALDKLRSLIKPHLWACYVLHGLILETSPKSGVTYIIRKSRPTVAMRPDKNGNMRVLTSLCLHPIGYYEGTHVGCMVPTDEVIAHLVMIRTREAYFWRKANQHPAHLWQSGI